MTAYPDTRAQPAPADVVDKLTYLEAEARRFAGLYPEASDGRNTFVMFADKIAGVSAIPVSDEVGMREALERIEAEDTGGRSDWDAGYASGLDKAAEIVRQALNSATETR
jgi:hypothetical protein